MATLPRSAKRFSTGVVAGLLATLALSACGSSSDDSDASADDPSASTSVETSQSASQSPSPSSPESTDPSQTASAPTSPSQSASSTPDGTPVDDLFLTAEEMPGLNDATVWTDAGTKVEGPQPFGDCAKFLMVDSGAEGAWVRSFMSEGTQRAAQLIATFADAKSAWRVEGVLRGWHRDCAQQLDADVEKVNPIKAAKVSTGKAFTYLLQFGREDAEMHHFNGFAVNRKGKHISIVLIDNEGQDYNYENGQEPAEQAARVVAEKLG